MSRGKGKTVKAAGPANPRKSPSTAAANKANPNQEWINNIYGEIEVKKLEVEALKMLEYSIESHGPGLNPTRQAFVNLKTAKEAELGQLYQRYGQSMFGQEFDQESANQKAVEMAVAKLDAVNQSSWSPAPENPSGWLTYQLVLVK